MRSGNYITQLKGDLKYKAFVPSLLPFSLKKDVELDSLLSQANLALGRLDGISEIVPDIDFLTLMYGRKEATYSSQVEGTQATFADVLKAEAKISGINIRGDVKEVLNYISAMNHGMKRINELPLSLRLIREIHKTLLQGVRGEERYPGEFKKTQNWVGGPTIVTASFVPCPPNNLSESLDNLEKFFYTQKHLPVLIKAGLIHTQFENIHPFLDGNGRTGRLLIAFYLFQQKILKKPLLYLSVYFKKEQKSYYYWLNRVHEKDDIEGWLKFFLKGVISTSEEAFNTARKILALKEKDTLSVSQLGRTSSNALKVLTHLYKNPYITLKQITIITELSRSNAYALMKRLEKLGILYGFKSSSGLTRIFVYKEYLSLFS